MNIPKPTPPPTVAAVYLKERDEIAYKGYRVRVESARPIGAGRIQLALAPLGHHGPSVIHTSVPANTIYRRVI